MAILGRGAFIARGFVAVAAAATFSWLSSCAASDPLAGSRDEELGFEVPDQPAEEDDGWISTGVVGDAPAPPPADVDLPDSPGERLHTVQKGDTLMALARRYYSDASKWRLILESNRDVINDPNRVFVGQELRIP